jgi:hypothetical protein
LVSEDEQPAESGSWSPSLPPAPSGFLERTTFTLAKREAKYLAERIWECGPTVFGKLLDSSIDAFGCVGAGLAKIAKPTGSKL